MTVTTLKIMTRFIHLATLIGLVSCGRLVTECGGAPLNIERLQAIQSTQFQSNSKAALVTPNPLDASGNVYLQALDSVVGSFTGAYFLPGLMNSNRLENNFLKIRISSISDSLDSLATPNSSGEFSFPISDIRYGQAMAYHSLSAIDSYVEALGFQTDKTRPLYVMVKAEGSTSNPAEVNAFYNHNIFESGPREIRIFGETQHSAWQDRDIYWHEFGHYVLESVTGSRGVDLAGDLGASFTEGSAIHECFADYGAESLSGRGYIGRWLARNFEGYAPGQPLRVAYDQSDEFQNFRSVVNFDPTGKNLDRYRLGEWCSRVLWDIRTQLVSENQEEGRYYADRTILSAASLLKRNTSISDLKEALLYADQELNCGIHSRSISAAFTSRGFPEEVSNLSKPLSFQGTVVGTNQSPTEDLRAFSVQFVLRNSNSQTARNVRIAIEAPNGGFSPYVAEQAYGDLGPGKTITVGGTGALPLDYSVIGLVSKTVNLRGIKVLIRIKIENGPESMNEVIL